MLELPFGIIHLGDDGGYLGSVGWRKKLNANGLAITILTWCCAVGELGRGCFRRRGDGSLLLVRLEAMR
jgi:hypothetical protein